MKIAYQKTAVAVLASLFWSASFAGSFYNQTPQVVTLSSAVDRGATILNVNPGQAVLMPTIWGDDKQLYVQVNIQGKTVCIQQYGVAKFATSDNHTLTGTGSSDANCSVFLGALPSGGGSTSGGTSSGSSGSTVGNSSANTGLVVLTNPLQAGNGTWIYDAQFTNGPAGRAYNKAGLWMEALNAYNKGATSGHAINQLFVYGGSLEMYCNGSGGSSDVCTSKNMLVYYFPPSFYNTNVTLSQMGDSGFESVSAYATQADPAVPVRIIPIIDGRVDSTGEDDYLSAFNRMDQATANLFADSVASVYCADPRVSGIQFDIEPFDLSQPGQVYFYTRIAQNLAGANPTLDLGCKNQWYPNGRSFSVFTFPSVIQSHSAVASTIFNTYHNGYAIYSLYDLPVSAPAGTIHSPEDYQNDVASVLVQAKALAAAPSNIAFQVAIPAAASVHEYEGVGTYDPLSKKVVGIKMTGYTQLGYVKAAIDAINASGIRNLPNFLGVDVWGWSKFMSYPSHTNTVYLPSFPGDSSDGINQSPVIMYLQGNL